jgi:hypothetical protein
MRAAEGIANWKVSIMMTRTFRPLLLALAGLAGFGCVDRKEGVTVIMRSSNEDCDEFKCIWTIDSVLNGNLDKHDLSRGFYLLNSKKEYRSREQVERILVRGTFTNEDWQMFYTDCRGTWLIIDDSVSVIKN